MEIPSSTSTMPLRLLKPPEPVILADQVWVQPVAPSKFPPPVPSVMVFAEEIPAPLAFRNRPPPSSEMSVLPPMLVSERKPMVPDVASQVPVKPLLLVPLITMLPLPLRRKVPEPVIVLVMPAGMPLVVFAAWKVAPPAIDRLPVAFNGDPPPVFPLIFKIPPLTVIPP